MLQKHMYSVIERSGKSFPFPILCLQRNYGQPNFPSLKTRTKTTTDDDNDDGTLERCSLRLRSGFIDA